MKLKKWLATALAALMAVGTMGVFAACGEDPADPEKPNNPGNPSDDTAIQYYLVGTGLGTLAASNWDQTSTDESLKFTRTGNILTITADLYEGDQFQVIHNQDWAGQMGADILDNEGKDAEDNQIFEGVAGGGGPMNIQVAEGQSGKYELTLTINSESDFASNTLTWKLVEKYDVVFVTWIDSDNTTELAKTVVKKNTTTTARTQTTTKRFYEFDKWVTKEGTTETAFDFTKPLTESVSFYASYKESDNANYNPDTSTWTIKIGNDVVATFTKNTTDYEQHNVYTVSYQFTEGNEFVITNGTTANAEITSAHASVFPMNADGTKYKAAKGANYQFTLITDVDHGTVTVEELFFEELTPLYSGYAVIGTVPGATWTYVEGVSPKLTETNVSGTYSTIIFVDASESEFQFKVSHIDRGTQDWNPEWNNGSGGNCVIDKTGAYRITVVEGQSTVQWEEVSAYYIVGGLEGASWSYVANVNPKLEKTTQENIFTGTITTTTAGVEIKVLTILDTSVSDLNWDLRNWGAENGANCISGANITLQTAGTYTVTLNIETNMLTVTLQQD